MQLQGVMLNLITYNALISACEKGKPPWLCTVTAMFRAQSPTTP